MKEDNLRWFKVGNEELRAHNIVEAVRIVKSLKAFEEKGDKNGKRKNK